MNMGAIIKDLRKDNNMTQEELGSRLDPPVNRQAVNKWETGRVENIKRSHIEQMAFIFNVKPSFLMGYEDSDETMQLAEELRRSPGMRMMFDAAKGCTEEDMRKVAAMIKAFKGDDE